MPNIHLPGRKPKAPQAKVTVQSLEGTLRKLAEKDLFVQVGAERGNGKVLRFRLIAKTEFRGKDGKPMRDSLLRAGDRLTIDATPDDPETALHVILVKAGSSSDREAAGVPFDVSQIATPAAGDFGRPHTSADAAGGGGTVDNSEDDDAPVLRRTETADSGSAKAAPVERAAGANPEERERRDDPAGRLPSGGPAKESVREVSGDPVIAAAREAASSFTRDLPNFTVDQVTTRFSGSRLVDNWRTVDTVTAEVSSVEGKEEYKNIRVNGRPTDRPEDSGSWSTGEFQITLEDILSPLTAATFTPDGDDRIAGRAAYVYKLAVEQSRSHWVLVAPSGRKYAPAYRGSIWIDKVTGRVLRIEQRAVSMPRDFAYDKTETALEYGYVYIEGQKYLLPTDSVNLACMTGTSQCSKNELKFRNYRKFGSESKITF